MSDDSTYQLLRILGRTIATVTITGFIFENWIPWHWHLEERLTFIIAWYVVGFMQMMND